MKSLKQCGQSEVKNLKGKRDCRAHSSTTPKRYQLKILSSDLHLIHSFSQKPFGPELVGLGPNFWISLLRRRRVPAGTWYPLTVQSSTDWWGSASGAAGYKRITQSFVDCIGIVGGIGVSEFGVIMIKSGKHDVHEIIIIMIDLLLPFFLMLLDPKLSQFIKLFGSFFHGFLITSQVQPPHIRNSIRHHKSSSKHKEVS
ncbi:hypothetical protein G4B88_024384 [Cannabis sativa]|uniref:Uncharacterized protein n=1 Tax=Cannabis sativa TaxID=3483 RepID=A0A7J6H6Z1_CANSA|nr:hypothetical protein G4B88_024384 [Cannabis sativa]